MPPPRGRDLALLALLAHDDVASLELLELLRTGFHESFNHFLLDILDVIDDFLHDEKTSPDMMRNLIDRIVTFSH